MAFHVQESLSAKYIEVAFSFDTNGAANPVAPSGIGYSSIVRTATGTYTITLDRRWPDSFPIISPNLMNPAGSFNYCAVGPTTNFGVSAAGLPTLIIYTVVAGALADIAANPNSRLMVNISLRNSTLPNN